MPPSPPLSVVMPVRNALPYLGEAVASILGQSFGDFELVILDDASDDGSTAALRGWAARDPRIRLFEGAAPLGPAGSSNRVVAEARAPIIARMDSDDVSHPDRLRRQLALFEAEPAAGLVASLWVGIDRTGRRVRGRDRGRLVRKSPFPPFAHGSIMFRRDIFDQAGGYRPECDFWEDIDLCLRMAEVAPAFVITDALYSHRFSETSTRLASRREAVEAAFATMSRCLDSYAPGHGYEAQLGAQRASAGQRVPPELFVALGSPALWAGASPDMLGPLRRRGQRCRDGRSAAVWIWALWGGIAPRSLRAFLNLRLRLGDARAGRRLRGRPYVEWRPQGAARAPRAAQLPAEAIAVGDRSVSAASTLASRPYMSL